MKRSVTYTLTPQELARMQYGNVKDTSTKDKFLFAVLVLMGFVVIAVESSGSGFFSTPHPLATVVLGIFILNFFFSGKVLFTVLLLIGGAAMVFKPPLDFLGSLAQPFAMTFFGIGIFQYFFIATKATWFPWYRATMCNIRHWLKDPVFSEITVELGESGLCFRETAMENANEVSWANLATITEDGDNFYFISKEGGGHYWIPRRAFFGQEAADGFYRQAKAYFEKAQLELATAINPEEQKQEKQETTVVDTAETFQLNPHIVTRKDWEEWLWRSVFHARSNAFLFLKLMGYSLLLPIALYTVGWILLSTTIPGASSGVFITFVILIAPFALIIFCWMSSFYYQSIAQNLFEMGGGDTPKSQALRLGTAALQVVTSEASVNYFWKTDVHRIVATTNLIVLASLPDRYLLFPKRAFESPEAAQAFYNRSNHYLSQARSNSAPLADRTSV